MNIDKLKEVMTNHERRMKTDKERGFLEKFQSNNVEDADFKREYTTGIQPIGGDLNQNEQLLALRKRLAEVTKTYHHCGREQRHIVGDRSFEIAGRTIVLDDVLYAYCDICDASTYEGWSAGDIEYRLYKLLVEEASE